MIDLSTWGTDYRYRKKYLTAARINSSIRQHNLEVAYTQGDGYFYFVDLVTRSQVGESVMVCKMHHLSLEQWRDAAKAARDAERD